MIRRSTGRTRRLLRRWLVLLIAAGWAMGCGGGSDLVLGETVERSFGEEEQHRYRLVLSGPQLIRFEVEQQGVDVALALVDGTREELVRVDSPTTAFGPETLTWLVDSGRYVLEVERLGRAAPDGHYVLSMTMARSRRPNDADLVRAERAFSDAGAAHWEGTTASYREAMASYRQALELFRASAQPRQAAWAQLNLDEIRGSVEDRWSAIRSHETTLEAFRAVADDAGVAETLGALAYDREHQGDKQEASSLWRQALEAKRRLGDVLGEANVLHNLAAFHASVGDFEVAETGYREALSRMREVDDRRGAVYTLTNLGALARKRGRDAEALEHLEAALALHRDAGDARATGRALIEIGVLHAQIGQPARAAEDLAGARDAFRQASSEAEEAVALAHRGAALRALGREVEARAAMDEALQLATQDGAPDFLREVLFVAAQQASAAGRQREAWALVSRALEQVESIRSRVAGRGWRASYLASRRATYALAIDILTGSWPAGSDWLDRDTRSRMALDVTERFRARTLIDHLRAARVDVQHGGDPALLERERALRRQVYEWAERLDLGEPPEAAVQLRQQLDAAERALQSVEADLRHQHPRYAAVTQARPSDRDQILGWLEDDIALVVYWLGEPRSHAWVVGRDGVVHRQLASKAEIDHAAATLLRHLVARNRSLRFETAGERVQRLAAADQQAAAAASALARLVTEPLAEAIAGRRLALVLDGRLHDVPLAALPWPRDAPPVIVHLPSASVLGLLRAPRADRPRATALAAVIADPVFDADDPRLERSAASPRRRGLDVAVPGRFGRLPFTRREAESVLRLLGRSEVLRAMGIEATREAMLDSDLGRYQIIHVATHALSNAKHPELSGLVLSLVDDAGRPRDGFLRLRDIYGLDLGAELVVLSGCRTAAAGASQEAGLVSLARGFMYAGATRVLASLWEVDDEATASLMEAFYESMLVSGRSPAEALALAQRSLRSDPRWRAPYYWAGFVLTGDWRS